MRKLRTLLTAYREAGGTQPVVLVHDEAHGTPLIDALARFGDGLPANVLPLAVNEVTQVGLEADRRGLRLWRLGGALSAAREAAPRRDRPDADARAGGADPRGPRLRRRARRHHRDRRSRRARRRRCARSKPASPRRGRRASAPVGGKREVLRLALRELHRAAPAPVDVVRAAGGRAVRHGRDRCRGLHALPRLRVGLPDRRARRRSRAADAALCRKTPACSADCARRPARRR